MPFSKRQQIALKRSQAPINVWYGAVRSGKTHAWIWSMLTAIAEHDGPGELVLIGLNRNTLWRNVFKVILSAEAFQACAPFVVYRQGGTTARIFGKELQIVSANDESSWMAIQGMTIAKAFGDEAVSWPKSFWDMLLTRLSLPTSQLFVTCNPGTANHYLKTEVIDKANEDPDIHVEKFLLSDNPALPKSYVKRLERSFSGPFYRRMILAEWVAAEGAVYQGWDPNTMTYNPERLRPQIDFLLSVGIDYGTNHPTAGYALALGEDGRLYIVSEWSPNLRTGTHRRLTDSQLSEELAHWISSLPASPRFIYVDPSAASFREELKSRGIQTYAADNHVVDGIRTVDSLLSTGSLLISEQCSHLTAEISGYRWDPKATEQGLDKPIKEADDHVDALRYTVHSCRHLWRKYLPQPTELDKRSLIAR